MRLVGLFVEVLFLCVIQSSLSESPSASQPATAMRIGGERNVKSTIKMTDIQIIFSDVDGTLVHYPQHVNEYVGTEGNKIIKLPPSSTGQQGIISYETLRRCQELRQRGKKLVLISGMRSTTLWGRIPYLPRADAYCCEAGGRVFYPVKPRKGKGPIFKLEAFDGAFKAELEPFGLEEDTEWRSRMEKTAGSCGFVGNELENEGEASMIPVDQRNGQLWAFCVELERKGFIVDTIGYATCFRVNRKQQKGVGEGVFDALSSIKPPKGLSTSVNLGCVDFYPTDSGKKNWYVSQRLYDPVALCVCSRRDSCQYVAKKLCAMEIALDQNALCLCDDDNDLEMALACRHAFVPGISSASMGQVVKENGNKITVTGGIGDLEEGTGATERALAAVLDMAI